MAQAADRQLGDARSEVLVRQRPPLRSGPPGARSSCSTPSLRAVGDRDRRRAAQEQAAGRPRQHLPHPRRARAPALVQRVQVGQDMARYEPIRTGEGHHHHLVCDSCGTVTPFTDEGSRTRSASSAGASRCASPSTRSSCAAPARSAPLAEGTGVRSASVRGPPRLRPTARSRAASGRAGRRRRKSFASAGSQA